MTFVNFSPTEDRQQNSKFGLLLDVINDVAILSSTSRIKNDLGSFLSTFQIDVWMLILLSFLLCTILTAALINWKNIDQIFFYNLFLLLGISIGKLHERHLNNNFANCLVINNPKSTIRIAFK